MCAGQEKIARLLIHNGADYTLKNGQGKTASDLATEKGNPKSRISYFEAQSRSENHKSHLNVTPQTITEASFLFLFAGFSQLARVLQENVAKKGKPT